MSYIHKPWLTVGDCPPGSVRRLSLVIFDIRANGMAIDDLFAAPLSGAIIEKEEIREEHLDITSLSDSQDVFLNRLDMYLTITMLYPIDPFVYEALVPIEKISVVLQENVNFPTEQVAATYAKAGVKKYWNPVKKLASLDEIPPSDTDYATDMFGNMGVKDNFSYDASKDPAKKPHKFLYTVTHYSIPTEKLANFLAFAGCAPCLGFVVTDAGEQRTSIKVLAEGTVSIAQYASYLYATDMLYRGRDEDTSSLLSRFYGDRALTFKAPDPEPVVLEAKPRRIKLR